MAEARAAAPDRAPRPPRRVEAIAVAALWFIAPFAALVAAWVLVLEVFDVPLRVFPTPGHVVDALRQQISSGTLGNHVWQSLRRVLVGSTLAVVTSVPLGVAISTNRSVAAFFTPVLRFFSVLAGIAWIPLATLWFGYGFGAITFIVFNAVFFVVVYNTILGVNRIRGDLGGDRPSGPGAHRAPNDRAVGPDPENGVTRAGAVARHLIATPAARTLGPFVPIVAAWAMVVELGVFPRAFFPGPLEVVRAFGDLVYKGILPAYLQDSVTRLAVGAAAGIALGVPFGLLVGLHAASYRFFWPIVIFFQAIGDIAWLPILLIWFGFTLTTMTFVIVYTVIFPMIFNAALGVRTVPVEMIRAAQSLGASPWRILVEVLIPGALPNIITGLRNGLGYGWRALIAAEIIVGTSGIGFMMFDARRAGSVVEMILGMIVLGILWYVVDAGIVAPLERATIERWGLTKREA